MSDQERIDFEEWHERRLHECQYPNEIVNELRKARTKWIASIKMLRRANSR